MSAAAERAAAPAPAPAVTVDLATCDFGKLNKRVFNAVAPEGTLPCYLQLLPGARRLFVMFNGAVDRQKSTLPVFARKNWGGMLKGHVLAICDPTLFLNEKLRLGWFLGNKNQDFLPAVVALTRRLEAHLQLDPGTTIFYGSSGGGFVALRAVALGGEGRNAIAINPQTEVWRYYAPAVRNIAEVFDAGVPAESSRTAHPLRWSALAALDDALRAHREFRVFYAQNTVDKFHHNTFFQPFCQHFGAPAQGGFDPRRRILTHVYDSPEGHGAEPPELVRHILGPTMDFFEGRA